MRDYQLAGLNWLIRLYENGINGILADEMVSIASVSSSGIFNMSNVKLVKLMHTYCEVLLFMVSITFVAQS